eukprot:CAMPEP_0172299800 /NCGR_PEP_ID=MMETSP1058-20130122/2014_1 /TAXON_ID=83371 /ORGANISM="Detonula confervacea, Strain CCMP 353" /LENGTH=298 /DNA_ID=CAMNT_0013009363 /DNA_START=173 /DNA_END=1069 /DNA_ORIENTATION=+
MNCPLIDQRHFPLKLYDMLEYVADSQYSSAVSWSRDGQAFVVHNKDTFLEYIVPMFFKQTKFRSFTRQLNLYGFARVSNEGPNAAWQHEHFIRGSVERLKSIQRVEVKNNKPKTKTRQLKNDKHKQRRTTRKLKVRHITEDSSTDRSLSIAISSISTKPAYASPKNAPKSALDQNHIMPSKMHQSRAIWATCDAPHQQASSAVSKSCYFSVESSSNSFNNNSTKIDRSQSSIPSCIYNANRIQHRVQPLVGETNEEDFLVLLSGIFESEESSHDDLSSILSQDDEYENFVNTADVPFE